MFEKTRRNLSVFFSLILAVILLLLTALFYVLLSGTLKRNEEAALEAVMAKAEQVFQHHKSESGQPKPGSGEVKREGRGEGERRNKGAEFEFIQSGQYVAIADKTGEPVLASSTEAPFQEALQQWKQRNPESGTSRLFSIEAREAKRTFLVFAKELPEGSGLLVTMLDITDHARLLEQMRLVLFVVCLMLLLLASLGGYLLAGKAMKPIARSFKRQQDFTADASHELRTPLSVLQSSVEILADSKSALPAFHQTVLANMEDEVRRMIRLTESLLTLARTDSGELLLKPERSDVARLVLEVMDRLRPLADRKQQSFNWTQTKPENDTAVVDVERTIQLLVILIDNAIKYTPEHGEIEVTLDSSDKELCFRVKDTGIGILPEQLPFVFERFFRTDKARSRENGGTGLGLSIAKWIVNAHGGTITAESEPGRGSTFIVRLPRGGPRA
ncbi:sensor histidine kinase [Paenibacillus sp. y28]|uniref:sensor histidine kinase n=1 Tax=Paenibacillus sp. y28 TaxID=3129110 RepID=UPI00301621CE